MDGRVVVITGASSGLGRAAAVAFARQGCRVALAARREHLLEEVATECRHAGGAAIAVRTDVTVADDVDALVRRTIETWGRIDVWINNAGVTMFGFLHQGEFDDHRRVIETNLLGSMLAARGVIPVFINQRSGTLINVASILGKVGQAFVPSYVISKFGLRGLTETLRVQVADYADIHICTLLPYAIDTPHFESGANAIGRAARAMQPIQTPEQVAAALVALAARPQRELHIPRYAALGFFLHWLAPRTVERLMLHALERFHLHQPQASTHGSLFEPCSDGGPVRGHRPPIVGRVAFSLWAVRELIAIVLSSTSRWVTPRTTRS